MELILGEWLNLALRWAHVITGIAWIGSSFFFMWLDSHLEPPTKAKSGVQGELWMTHSGGFYLTEKMTLTPAEMPKTLHWFKWEAAFTWITGFLLLVWIYYVGANVYLIDPAKADIGPFWAVLIGLAVLALSWAAYDTLWRSRLGENTLLATAISFGLLVVFSLGLSLIFSGRGAYMHMGAILGTIMAANVWMRILPAQRQLVAATKAGETPDADLAKAAKQRSIHNNYMTLPVVFVMVSSHYPSTFGSSFGWLVLLVLFAIGATVRHWFNLRNQGESSRWPIPAAVAGFLLLAILSSLPADTSPEPGAPVSFSEARAVIANRCVPCHSATPANEDFSVPPKDVAFDTPVQIKRKTSRILAVAVISKAMPPGGENAMTQEERELIGRWILQGANIE